MTPLREGGSLPAIVEADDLGLYVLKFRAAGQGVRALIAELIGAQLARELGIRVPDVALVEVPSSLGRNEPDSEIRELLRGSAGTNLALDYLPGSITFDPTVGPAPDADTASAIVWFDAFITNVDRTPRNPNLLCWHGALYVIDHGASLYFHHAWADPEASAKSPFAAIKDHVLLPWADALDAAGTRLSAKLGRAVFERVVSLIPDAWLADPRFADPAAHRAAYVDFLQRRLEAAPIFVEEAARARAQLL